MKTLNKYPNIFRYIDEYGYATYGSVVLGIGDIVWLSKDIIHNGFVLTYGIIALLFLVGNVILVLGLHEHHKHIKESKANRRELKKVKHDDLKNESTMNI